MAFGPILSSKSETTKRQKKSSMNNGRLAFFNLVKKMRAAQKEYFRTRTHSVLVRSKDLERRFDDELARGDQYLKQQQQPSLFPDKEQKRNER